MTYAELVREIHETIKNEFEDSKYYIELAKKTADVKVREIINNIAKDKKEHAYVLKEAYFRLTGRMPMEVTLGTSSILDYKESLKQRVLSEVKAGEKYRDLYISTKVDWLRDIFFKIMYDGSENASKLLLIVYNADEIEDSVPAKHFSAGFQGKS